MKLQRRVRDRQDIVDLRGLDGGVHRHPGFESKVRARYAPTPAPRSTRARIVSRDLGCRLHGRPFGAPDCANAGRGICLGRRRGARGRLPRLSPSARCRSARPCGRASGDRRRGSRPRGFDFRCAASRTCRRYRRSRSSRSADRRTADPRAPAGPATTDSGRSKASMSAPRLETISRSIVFLQLPHVARPGVPQQRVERLRREHLPLSRPPARIVEEAADQQRDVRAPLPKRRDPNDDDAEPVVQVLPEAPLGDRLLERQRWWRR